jgi:hypothetical protein
MKSLRGLTCFVVVILLLGFIVGHGLAALPDSREIKDQFMWGDPDCPWSRSRGADRSEFGDSEQPHRSNGDEVAVSIGIGATGITIGAASELAWPERSTTSRRGGLGHHMSWRMSSAIR